MVVLAVEDQKLSMRDLQHGFNTQSVLWRMLLLLLDCLLKWLYLYSIFQVRLRNDCRSVRATHFLFLSPGFMGRPSDHIHKTSFLVLLLFLEHFFFLFLLIIDLFDPIKKLLLNSKFHHLLPRVKVFVNVVADNC